MSEELTQKEYDSLMKDIKDPKLQRAYDRGFEDGQRTKSAEIKKVLEIEEDCPCKKD